MTAALRVPQAALFVALLACVAFINSFGGQFVFDDIHEIVRNPSLRQLFPPWKAMLIGNTLPARPLPYLSFAIDYAFWGDNVFGYHLTNLAIHVVAALALFDVVRLALMSPRLRGRWVDQAVPLAMVIATLWAVHPLQTQAVTYIYQRIESMTGMFCLVALACFAEASMRGWSRGWLLGSIAASAGAMASKENAVVLPLLILAYDWLFVPAVPGPDTPANWARGFLSRGWYYLLLAATWGILAAVLLSQRGRYQEFRELQHRPWEYLLTQSEVILHYLRLAFFPIAQQFDYGGWPVAKSFWDVWPSFLAVAATAFLTGVATLCRRPAAWFGIVFFLALAPTSSIMPVEAVANEHRMYLALAAVCGAVAIGFATVYDLSSAGTESPSASARRSRAALALTGMAVLILVVLTQLRNEVYGSITGVWLDTLRKDRESARAYYMMAVALDVEGDPEFAKAMAEEVIRRQPKSSVISEMARYQVSQGNPDLAEHYLRFGYDLLRTSQPLYSRPLQTIRSDLATVLNRQRKFEESRALCEEVLSATAAGEKIFPLAEIACSILLADACRQAGNLDRADSLSDRALELALQTVPRTDANSLNAACLRADVLFLKGRRQEARSILEDFVRALRSQGTRTAEQQGFLELFLSMLRDSAEQSGMESGGINVQRVPRGN